MPLATPDRRVPAPMGGTPTAHRMQALASVRQHARGTARVTRAGEVISESASARAVALTTGFHADDGTFRSLPAGRSGDLELLVQVDGLPGDDTLSVGFERPAITLDGRVLPAGPLADASAPPWPGAHLGSGIGGSGNETSPVLPGPIPAVLPGARRATGQARTVDARTCERVTRRSTAVDARTGECGARRPPADGAGSGERRPRRAAAVHALTGQRGASGAARSRRCGPLGRSAPSAEPRARERVARAAAADDARACEHCSGASAARNSRAIDRSWTCARRSERTSPDMVPGAAAAFAGAGLALARAGRPALRPRRHGN
jgi:hypothetical protein